MSPRIGAIALGILIWIISWYVIPDPNAPITNAPWPHKWIYVYCNHALVWIHWDDAESGHCNPGPTPINYMAYYQTGARYPIYWIILNAIPYTYPAIAGFLVWWLLLTWYRRSPSGTVPVSLPKLQKDQICYVYVVILVMITIVWFLLVASS
jgi:hypothetical protein